MSVNLGVTSKYNPETRVSFVTVSVSIPAEPPSAVQPFTLNAAYSGTFKFDENFPEENLEYFQKVNCPAIIFPYLRESVADIVRRSGLPSLHLPPFNFVAMYKKSAEKPKKKPPASKVRKNKPKADSEH
jgi:preprotein translocase subunit SecB